MTASLLAVAVASDRERATATVVMAFSADPVARWLYLEASRYLTYFPELVQLFGGKAFQYGTAYCVEAYAGTALWLPPGVHPDDEPLTELLNRSIAEREQEKVFAVFEQMAAYHPAEPHWYLPLIGVDPAWQNKGYGTALLRHALMYCDQANELAYLESSNPANLPLYERHGFNVLGKIQVADSPPLWPMLRKPR